LLNLPWDADNLLLLQKIENKTHPKIDLAKNREFTTKYSFLIFEVGIFVENFCHKKKIAAFDQVLGFKKIKIKSLLPLFFHLVNF
jgi:hypothetical protein